MLNAVSYILNLLIKYLLTIHFIECSPTKTPSPLSYVTNDNKRLATNVIIPSVKIPSRRQ